MRWNVVMVQQPAVVGPQLRSFSRNYSPQRLQQTQCSMQQWQFAHMVPSVSKLYSDSRTTWRSWLSFAIWTTTLSLLEVLLVFSTPNSAIVFQDCMQKSNFRLRLSHDRKHSNFLTIPRKCGRKFLSVRCSDFLEPICTLFVRSILQ